jgi:hypothetical protein
VSFRHAANLGALFTHDGSAETVYSTSTVDTTQPGTTTLDYWAVVPSTQQWLHATRTVIIDLATAPSIVPDYNASTTLPSAPTVASSTQQ